MTFRLVVSRNKDKSWQEDIQDITARLRSAGFVPQGWERDENNFTIGGNVKSA